jgi:hypothetical protein
MYSSSRNGAQVRVICLHTTEGIMSAVDLRAFFNRPTATGSSHASADATGLLLSGSKDGFVDYSLAAWTLRNGNAWSDNMEMCGWASWTRADWLARPNLLEATAGWLAERHLARPYIPLRRLSVDELRAGQYGVIDHNTYTLATGDGTHWDVGTGFPWDVVMPRAQQLANGEVDDMYGPAERDEVITRLDEMRAELYDVVARLPTIDAIHVGLNDPTAGTRKIVIDIANTQAVSDEDLVRIADAVADELDRRQGA